MYPNDRILVVEDDTDHYDLIVQGFSRAHITNQIVRARTAAEALSYLKREGDSSNRESNPLPCLVLLDLNLPDDRGFVVLEAVRNHPDLRKLPVVVLTVSNADGDVEKAYRMGANSYLVKPFRIEELRTLMKSINAYWVLLAEKPRL